MSLTRRWLAPETVQSSDMDCGPAALACLLEGHRLPVSYPRLRDACQTDLDGTSVSTIAEVANELGLAADEVLIPSEHVFGTGSLPALAVVNNPDGSNHFVVLWRECFGLVQVMDPATGRRWLTKSQLRSSLYEHVAVVPAHDWREWAAGEDCQRVVRARMRRLGIRAPTRDRLASTALADASWRGIAFLDAVLRLLSELVASGAIRRGAEAERSATTLLEGSGPGPGDDGAAPLVVPRNYWSVQPAEAPDDPDAEPQLVFRGSLLVRVYGRRARDPSETRSPSSLGQTLTEETPKPGRKLASMLRADGWFSPAVILGSLAIASAGLLVEALLFRTLIELAAVFGLADQRLKAALVLMSFLLLMFILEIPIATGLFRAGRRLDARFRLALHRKLPRLSDHYHRSRLISDTAHRGHSLHALRNLPVVGSELVRAVTTVVMITAAISWWVPASAWIAVLAAVLAISVPLVCQPALSERDLRVQTHEGALSRFYLDALAGLVPLRMHGGGRALRRQHERLLVEWSRARFSRQRFAVALQGVQQLCGYSLAGWMLVRELARPDGAAAVLLLAYWALQFPALGAAIGDLGSRYPALRNTARRLLEPLEAPERAGTTSTNDLVGTEVKRDRDGRSDLVGAEVKRDRDKRSDPASEGVSVRASAVSVERSGMALLEDLSFEISAGEHVAIVGVSGAGKSTLLGLLHGWVELKSGRMTVDGERLDEAVLERLRGRTAWVDPSVQLWNQTFLGNMNYGLDPRDAGLSMSSRLESSELKDVLEQLPDGQQGSLGESGGLVSGGEGQRVRFARALGRSNARLVLFDEPFRGLAREQRQRMLERARRVFERATFLCVTHDVGETLDFDRVFVLEGGRLVENGAPRDLLARLDSRYRALLASEKRADAIWKSPDWRKWSLDAGVLADGGLKEEVS